MKLCYLQQHGWTYSVILSEANQRKRNIIWYLLYVECKRNDTNKLIYKTERDSQT